MGPKRRRLADTLRTHREHAGLSTTELARALGWSQSKVTKIENGRTRAAVADVAVWAGVCQVSEGDRIELIQLADEVGLEARTWRNMYRDAGGVAARQSTYEQLNADAIAIAIYQPAIVPGLAQTATYARRTFELMGVDEEEAGQAASRRIERQAVLYDLKKSIELLVTEAALRLPVVTSGAMRAQLDRLRAVSDLPNVRFGLIPLSAPPASLPLSAFVLRRFGDGEAMVTVETLAGENTLRDPSDVSRYEEALRRHWTVALEGPRAGEALDAIAHDLGREPKHSPPPTD